MVDVRALRRRAAALQEPNGWPAVGNAVAGVLFLLAAGDSWMRLQRATFGDTGTGAAFWVLGIYVLVALSVLSFGLAAGYYGLYTKLEKTSVSLVVGSLGVTLETLSLVTTLFGSNPQLQSVLFWGLLLNVVGLTLGSVLRVVAGSNGTE